MDWIRENKTLASILGVIIAGVLGLGYMLYNAWDAYVVKKDEYIALGARVASIKGMALAPTPENLQQKQAAVDEYGAKVNQLSTALLFLQPTPAPITDADFQKKLLERIKKIKEMADALKVRLPPDFGFGFSEYLGSLPKSDAIATELSGYLDGVEAIVKLAIASKVVSIDLLDRTKLPSENEGAPAPAAGKKSASKAAPKAAVAASRAISEKNTVSIVATLDQAALQTFMSRLANPADMKSESDPAKSHFTSIRLLRVENQARVGPPRSAANRIAPAQPEAAATPEAAPAPSSDKDKKTEPTGPVAIVPPAPAQPDSMPVIGQEKLKLQLEIDLVKFLSPQTASTGNAARP
ncbi:MAG: hypothetical protein IPK32_05580 [Verrucomicrobiaceae bacterium]|nr:hypothetical protein [Verrucomicrobiaceae bacterium]